MREPLEKRRQEKVVARGSGTGAGRGRQSQRGTVRQDKRLTPEASARLVHRSSSFPKLAKLRGDWVLAYKRVSL